MSSGHLLSLVSSLSLRERLASANGNYSGQAVWTGTVSVWDCQSMTAPNSFLERLVPLTSWLVPQDMRNISCRKAHSFGGLQHISLFWMFWTGKKNIQLLKANGHSMGPDFKECECDQNAPEGASGVCASHPPYLHTYKGVLKYAYFKSISECRALSSPLCHLQRQCRWGIYKESR